MVRLSKMLLGIAAFTAIALYVFGIIGGLALIIALAPLPFYLLMYFAYIVVSAKLALMGYFGEGQKWAAELVNENDMEFIHALHSLNRMQAKEEMVIAESKQEFRERVIARSNDSD